jgi:putative toxin-antitoxin system antitoxin component (TIGR02293 family)
MGGIRSNMRYLEPFSDFSFPRAAEIYDACLELFSGNRENAWEWLSSPVRGLGYACPIEYAKTETGAMEVRNLIGRLEHGFFS